MSASVHVTEELTALLDGELCDTDRARVEAHLQGCEACAHERALLVAAMAGLEGLPGLEPSADLRRRVLSALDEQPAGLGARIRALLSPRLLIPVSAAAAAGLAFALFPAGPRPARPEAGEELAIAERLELLEDYDLLAMAADDGINAADLEVVAHLHELED